MKRLSHEELVQLARKPATDICSGILTFPLPAEVPMEQNEPYRALVAEMAFQNTILFVAAIKWKIGSTGGEKFLKQYYPDAGALTLERWKSCPFIRAAFSDPKTGADLSGERS